MVTRHSKKSKDHTDIAKARVEELFLQADRVFGEDSALADRYVDLARKMAMKFKIRMKSENKRKFCKHCYKYLRPGVNSRVRNQGGKVVYTCFSCKKFSALQYQRRSNY